MSDKKHRKELKRKAKLRDRERNASVPQDLFFDGLDSYDDAFAAIVAKPPVHCLLGVYLLDNETFYGKSTEEKVAHVGFPNHSVINWESGIEHDDHRADPESKATGFASCLTDEGGKTHPIIFIRQDVKISRNAPDKAKVDLPSTILFNILLHEMGHADDMCKEINFHHETKTMDLVAAEAYAHIYALNFARKKNYRFAVQLYILDLEGHVKQPEPHIREAAQRVLDSSDMPQFREFSTKTSFDISRHRKIIEARVIRGLAKHTLITAPAPARASVPEGVYPSKRDEEGNDIPQE